MFGLFELFFPGPKQYSFGKDDITESIPINNINSNVLVAKLKSNGKKVVVKKSNSFHNELEKLRLLNRCNNIQKLMFYDYCNEILVFSFNPQMDLFEWLSNGVVSFKIIHEAVMRPMILALKFIHSKGFAHRDVKPENILFDSRGCKLTDFEMCQRVPYCGYFDDAMGSVAFLAPECFMYKACKESDLWALGVVYYECIYKDMPFEDNNMNDTKREVNTVLKVDLDMNVKMFSILQILLNRDPQNRKGCYDTVTRLLR